MNRHNNEHMDERLTEARNLRGSNVDVACHASVVTPTYLPACLHVIPSRPVPSLLRALSLSLLLKAGQRGVRSAGDPPGTQDTSQ